MLLDRRPLPPNGMSWLQAAALVGGGMAAGAFTADAGAPPLDALLDPVVWLAYGLVAGVGAFTAVSVVLAWRHARESPRWLAATLLGLILLSQPVVSPYLRERRQMQRLLATAESTQGIVAGKYYRGNVRLTVEYQVDGQAYRLETSGSVPLLGTPEFSRWSRGDSIPVYYPPAAPHQVRVGPRGPEPRILFESLAKVWSVWGVLLTAYLPLMARGLWRRLALLRDPLQSFRR